MKPPFRLVPREISHDTLEALRVLYEQAKDGEIMGMTLGVMYRDRFFATGVTGESHRNPTFSIGIVHHLLAKLVRLAEAIDQDPS